MYCDTRAAPYLNAFIESVIVILCLNSFVKQEELLFGWLQTLYKGWQHLTVTFQI